MTQLHNGQTLRSQALYTTSEKCLVSNTFEKKVNIKVSFLERFYGYSVEYSRKRGGGGGGGAQSHVVCPTKARTRVLSDSAMSGPQWSDHTPFTPARSMDACSFIPTPLLTRRSEPFLPNPEHVTTYNT